MPQLGFETFVSQYFWLVLILFTLYFIMITKLIPLISETLKARNNLDTKSKLPKNLIKDSSLIKDIVTLKFTPAQVVVINQISYNSTFARNFITWSNKYNK